jgi:MATE family multidrug resistance protein
LKGLWTGWACGLAVSACILLIRLTLLNWEEMAKNMLVEVVEDDK